MHYVDGSDKIIVSIVFDSFVMNNLRFSSSSIQIVFADGYGDYLGPLSRCLCPCTFLLFFFCPFDVFC